VLRYPGSESDLLPTAKWKSALLQAIPELLRNPIKNLLGQLSSCIQQEETHGAIGNQGC
jgi:hypothetical protein